MRLMVCSTIIPNDRNLGGNCAMVLWFVVWVVSRDHACPAFIEAVDTWRVNVDGELFLRPHPSGLLTQLGNELFLVLTMAQSA